MRHILTASFALFACIGLTALSTSAQAGPIQSEELSLDTLRDEAKRAELTQLLAERDLDLDEQQWTEAAPTPEEAMGMNCIEEFVHCFLGDYYNCGDNFDACMEP